MAREVAENLGRNVTDGLLCYTGRYLTANEVIDTGMLKYRIVDHDPHAYCHSSYGKAVHARLATLGFRHFIPIHTPCTFPRTRSLTPDLNKILPSFKPAAHHTVIEINQSFLPTSETRLAHRFALVLNTIATMDPSRTGSVRKLDCR